MLIAHVVTVGWGLCLADAGDNEGTRQVAEAPWVVCRLEKTRDHGDTIPLCLSAGTTEGMKTPLGIPEGSRELKTSLA
jgi:hypothetical protein